MTGEEEYESEDFPLIFSMRGHMDMKEHILVVDNDHYVCEQLSSRLHREGFSVSSAATSSEALSLAARHSVDLVVYDPMMDSPADLHFLHEIRGKNPRLPVIVFTRYPSINTAIESVRIGVSDYIEKPIHSDELVARIKRILDKNRMNQDKTGQEAPSDSSNAIQETLVRAERMVSLGVLAEGVAFELNNILAPVVSYPDLILDHLHPNHPAKAYIEEIRDAGHRATAIVRDLQTMGRQGDCPTEPVDLNRIIADYLSSPDFQLLQKKFPHIAQEIDLSEHRPMMAGSRNQLLRMLGNLVLNAMEAMPNGGRLSIKTQMQYLDKPRGYFETGHPGHYIVLSVEDNGFGMEKSDMEHIFEPFYSRKQKQPDRISGLGLTVVYRVVHNHRGFLDVQSEPGRGSRFTMAFPLLAEPEIRAPQTSSPYTGTGRILVVDDYEVLRNVAKHLLETLGYEVITARSGKEAVRMFEEIGPVDGKHPIDLIVLDMVLGDDFDGLDTYKRLIELNPGQKVVIVSGFAETDRVIEARQLGAGQFVQKPYTMESLGKAIREELDKS